MVLFGRRKSTPADDVAPLPPTKTGPKRATTFATRKKGRASDVAVDELGRTARGQSAPPSGGAPLRRSYSDGSRPRPLSRGLDGEELQLAYGYLIVGTEVTLELVEVEEIVRLCGDQIKARGLDQPLLFSVRALDLSGDGTSGLIRSYLTDKRVWRNDLQFANCHDLAAVVKWALGRVTTPQGAHGFLPWEMYERWRAGEREKGYPPRYLSTHLLHHLPTSTAALLSTLLSLMSSAAAYTVKNGTDPRRLAALFSSYVFGLPDDEPFEPTYNAFLRFSHALEHLLLSYIRDQREIDGHLPTNLLKFISDYPADLQLNLNRPSPNASLATVARVRRAARFNSRDLIRSAGTWDVPRSRSWATIFPMRALTQPDGSPTVAFSNTYKKLLNLRASGASTIDDEGDEDPSMQRYKDSADKEWMAFKEVGFAASDGTKLKFDLRESERTSRRKKHETMDWTSFADSGFVGRESYVNTDLLFDPKVNDLVTSWPTENREITARLRKTEKDLPPFPHDITPTELNPVSVDEAFFETWCDVLISSGWQRDQIKASNWVLIQYRCRPKEASASPVPPGADGRTAERWFLIEELVPKEYLQSLVEGKTKAKTGLGVSFLRSVRRKPKSSNGSAKMPQGISYSSLSASAPPSSLPPRSSPRLDESVFQPGPGETKQLKLSNSHGVRLTPAVTPDLSRATTVKRLSHGDDRYTPAGLANPEEPVPSIPAGYLHAPAAEAPLSSPKGGKFKGLGIGGTLSSQRPDVNTSKPTPPSPTTSSATSDRVKPPSPTTALLASFRRHSNIGGNSRDRRRDAGIAHITAFEYETHSVSSLPEEAAALSPSPNGHDERWVDVVRSPRGSAPAPLDMRYPTSAADLHAPLPTPPLRVRTPTEEGGLTSTVPSTPDRVVVRQRPRPSEETQTTDESPYDGVADDEEDAAPVWRGSRADATLPPAVDVGSPFAGARSHTPSPVPRSPSHSSERLPSTEAEAPVETIKELQPGVEDPISKAARLRAKYGSGVDNRHASNVSRLISLYAKRDDGAQPATTTA